jgi:hypothetical protein
MNAHRGATKKGRAGSGETSPLRPDDARHLLDELQVNSFLKRLDLVPKVDWCWITTSDPITEDGSVRLILQRQLPAPGVDSHFAFTQRIKSFARWKGYRYAIFGATFSEDPGTGPRLLIPFAEEITARFGHWNVLLLYRSAFSPEFPALRIELVWRPAEQLVDQEIGTIDGIPTEGRNKALKTGAHGLALLDMVAPSGRREKDAATIRATIDPVVRNLKSTGLDPTQDRVAEHLPRRRGRARSPRVIRRWIKDGLGMTWKAYIDSVN